MATEYQIGTLWIGDELSYLEQLCLKSFVDAGHHVVLYTYGGVTNAPSGVTMADAAEVVPQSGILRHARTDSPALHADLFRYRLLARADRMIWADTDAYCLRPFTTASGHFYAWESAALVNGGVLRLPPDSPTLQALIDFTADGHAIPPWLDISVRAELLALRDAGRPVHACDMPWGVWGPHALTHFLKATGEVRHALPRVALYPFAYEDRRLMLRPGLDPSHHVTDQTFSIHFYGRRMRAALQGRFGGVPKVRSLVGQLLRKHGIDPAAAPLRGPAPPAEAGDAD